MLASDPHRRGLWLMVAGSVDSPLLRVQHVVKEFPLPGRFLRGGRERVHAVSDVSFDVAKGQTLAVVGESGSGKSTLVHCVTRLYDLTSGTVILNGRDISMLSRRELRPVRRDVQMIFQDPYGSLNPRRTVGAILSDPFLIHAVASGRECRRRVQELMEVVGLNPEHYNRYPAEFSGGQRQRVGIARALALRPRLIVCDEPVSALDLSISAQVINLLADLQREFSLTYLLVAHDLSVVHQLSDRVLVMYLGQIAELAPSELFYSTPRHPYSHTLLAAAPAPDPDASDRRHRVILGGEVPSAMRPPAGCRFHTRCPRARDVCGKTPPPLEPVLGDPASHLVACHFPLGDGERLIASPPHRRAPASEGGQHGTAGPSPTA
jgi:oligopeptide/dipeptide ABC transporter ATP-binding protein